MNFAAGETPSAAADVDWAADVAQGVCRPGCDSDIWLRHGGFWCPAVLAPLGPFVQVPPTKPGTIALDGDGSWTNTTVYSADLMIRSSGSSEDHGTVQAEDGHYYWRLARKWEKSEVGNPKAGALGAWVPLGYENIINDKGECMLNAAHQSFSLVRWVRSPLAHGAVTLFENCPSSNPEIGWNLSINPAKALAVSKTAVQPGQVSASGQPNPPPPPSEF